MTCPLGVTAKDFALRVIGDLGADGGLYMSIEFTGSGISALSLESRMVIPNMMAEFGAKNAYLAPDEKAVEYLAERLHARLSGRNRVSQANLFARNSISPSSRRKSRPAVFTPIRMPSMLREDTYHAADLETYIACPHTMDNVAPLSQVAGTRIQQAFLGTCTNGRLEDLAAAAAVIRGRQVPPGVRFIVIPASSQVLKAALELGIYSDLCRGGCRDRSARLRAVHG